MVKSTPLPNGAVLIKTRRKGARVSLLMLLLVSMIAVALLVAAVGLFAPNNLALLQEQTLGMLRGGIVAQEEQTFVDGCVHIEGFDAAQAITRTRRTVFFGDGTALEVVFSGRPTPTNTNC